jgi:hypothetical protein
MDVSRFEKAPCYICGYNGVGYFQPSVHPCAEKYHAELHKNADANQINRLRTQLTALKAQLAERDKKRCEHCGSDHLVDKCGRCGAPQCCDVCCQITSLRDEIKRLRKDRDYADDCLRNEAVFSAALTKRNGELTDGLKRLEWIDSASEGADQECPACWQFRDNGTVHVWWPYEKVGHKPDCWLSKLIGGKE